MASIHFRSPWRAISMLCAMVAMTSTQAAVPWSAQAGTTRVLLAAADGETQAELLRVAEILQNSYGASPDTTRVLFGENARSDAIENAMFEMSARTSPRDTLIVVLGLALHNEGRDRLMVTYDFNPEKPWSGLSLDLLGKLAAGGVAGSYWQFAPDCSPPVKKGLEQYEQRSNAYAGDPGGGVVSISFCEGNGASPGRQFARAFAMTLKDAADYHKGGGSTGSGGAVPSDEVLGRLSKYANGFEIHNDYAMTRGAVLRVRPASTEPVGSELYAALKNASDDVEAVAVLDRAVEQGRAAKDPAKAADVANALVEYSIKSGADPNRRARAIQALGSLPAEAARPALERVFFQASEARLRANVLREWQRVAKPGDTSLLRKGLNDGEPLVQMSALQAVATAGDKGSADAVIKALQSAGDSQVRMAAARALIEVAEPAIAEKVLIDALADDSDVVRAEVANSMGKLALSSAAVGPLIKAANTDAAALARENAVYALGAVWPQVSGDERQNIERDLLNIAGSARQGEGVRVAALYTLARSGSVTGSQNIINIARNEEASPALRKAAMEAIGQLKLVGAASVLTTIARNPKEKADLRVAATASLGYLPDSKAVDAIWGLAESDSVDISAAARRGLELSTAFSPAAASALGDGKLPVERRIAAARLLGNSLEQRSFDPLIGALADPRRELRDAAIASLSRFKDPPFPERMAQLLASPNDPARQTHEGVAFALAAMNTDEARKILEAHVGHSDNDVRHAVALGLGTAKSTASGYAALKQLSHDESDRVRVATAISLGRIENMRVTEVLEPMTKDKDPDVRAAAVESLRAVLARGTPSQRRS